MLIAGAAAASLSGRSSPAQAESVTHPQDITDLILNAAGRRN